MNLICRVLLGCALVALPVSASDSTSGMQNFLGSNVESMLNIPENFFTPSAERLALQKLQLSLILSEVGTLADPEQYAALKKVGELSIEYEEELLKIYTEMLSVKAQIDAESDPEARKGLRAKLRDLLEKYKTVAEKRDLSLVEAGILSAEKAQEILGLEETKFMKKVVDEMVLGKFEKYI